MADLPVIRRRAWVAGVAEYVSDDIGKLPAVTADMLTWISISGCGRIGHAIPYN